MADTHYFHVYAKDGDRARAIIEEIGRQEGFTIAAKTAKVDESFPPELQGFKGKELTFFSSTDPARPLGVDEREQYLIRHSLGTARIFSEHITDTGGAIALAPPVPASEPPVAMAGDAPTRPKPWRRGQADSQPPTQQPRIGPNQNSRS